jgi:tetratricopeptide (TPR) repeat protein
VLRQDFQIALTRGRSGEAETTLDILERLEPGDPEILPLRADLAEQKGNLAEAAVRMAEAVEQVPSWQNRYRLANLEARRNRIEAAREQIEAILVQSPDNLWAQEALGNLEINYGNLSRAEEIYRKLVDSVPERAYGNLATIQALSDHFQEAAVFYQKALDAQPEHPPALINLAEVEKELGHDPEAEDLYRRALERLQKSEADASLTPVGSLLKAQCLARLGQTQEAVAIAREQLDKNPDDAALRFQITLIYSLAGERASAIEHAKAALARGIQPRWFTGSPLRWLRGAPELRSWFQEAR